MNKKSISRFIQKYHLNGNINSVRWIVKNNELSTSFITSDRTLLGNVKLNNFKFDNSQIGINDTSQLNKLLNILGDDMSMSLTKFNNKAISLNVENGVVSFDYPLADLSVIPVVPDLKQLPDFNGEITLDNEFISTFVKSKGALSESDTFTFSCKNNKGSVVLGYQKINSNRISINVNCKCDGDIEPISFSAKYLKEILNANKGAKSSSLKVSSQGLAFATFEKDGFTSNYYLVEIK